MTVIIFLFQACVGISNIANLVKTDRFSQYPRQLFFEIRLRFSLALQKKDTMKRMYIFYLLGKLNQSYVI